MNKRAQPTFWKKYEDYFGYGLLAAVVLFFVYANFTGDRRKPSQIPINEDTFMQQHNEELRNYTLKGSEFFEGLTIKDAQ